MGTQPPAYHAESIESVADELSVDPSLGLPSREAGRRLERYGHNRLEETKKRGAGSILLDQFKSVVILVLLVAGFAALLLGHWTESIAIGAVLFVNAAIGFITEFKAVRSMEALMALGGDTIRVRRNGETLALDATELVPGDVIVLESGDLAPADVRLTEANGLRVNQSPLTGESVAVHKRVDPVDADVPLADRATMIYKGTVVTEGSGEGIVTATGMATELGRIAELTEAAEKETTPLQHRLDRLGRRLAVLTLTTAAVVAVAGLIAGRDPRQMIETAIALGVAAIPEGLPIVATIALARGVHLMARRNALVNRLPAVETLGATGIIFTDKTGTLTENRMTLRRICTPDGDFQLDGQPVAGSREKQNHPLLLRALEVGVLCNNAALRLSEDEGEVVDEQGDPTETALLRAGNSVGIRRPELLALKPETREVPFDAEWMMMATYHRLEQGMVVAVKGAPDRVLGVCDRLASVRNGEAADKPMDDESRSRWIRRAESLAGEGLRVLAVADKSVSDDRSEPYEGLCFVGLVGLLDPPRADVREAIEECRAAGIRVIMVTGDQPATALAIARETGVVRGRAPTPVHGSELETPDKMSREHRMRLLDTSVFARVSPKQKLNLIRLMQASGETVAMTGDGVNDAPALKKADIGVAMGKRGTDAARQVADMVLQDDAFVTIVSAVRHGRIIFGNIRKSVMFMLCTNMAEVVAVVAAAVAGGFSRLPIPLLPLQILFLNVVTDVFPALALGMGGGDPDVMRRNPRPQGEPVLTPRHWMRVGGWALLVAACVLSALAIAVYGLHFDPLRAVTVSFLTLGFAKLWFVFNLRKSRSRLVDNDIVNNPYIWVSIGVCIVLLVGAVYLPGLSKLLRTVDPGGSGWLLVLGMSPVPFLWDQFLRAVRRRTVHR